MSTKKCSILGRGLEFLPNSDPSAFANASNAQRTVSQAKQTSFIPHDQDTQTDFTTHANPLHTYLATQYQPLQTHFATQYHAWQNSPATQFQGLYQLQFCSAHAEH